MSRDVFNRDKGTYGLYIHSNPKTKKGSEGSKGSTGGCACSDDTYTPSPVKVLQKSEQGPGVTMLRIGAKLKHAPGQFLQCSVLGVGEAAISFASHSNEYVELNIRDVGRVSHALCKLKRGDTIHIRGPYGNGYPMKELEGNDLIIVGAGTGVAPLRGVIKYIEQHRSKYGKISLLFGFHDPASILFKEDMEKWSEMFDLCISVSHAPRGYHGDIGHCTDALRKQELNNHGKVAMICGPPMMIEQAIDILKTKSFNDDQIFLSHERHMKCATGVCGHCMIHGVYTCKDGPVFRYDKIKNAKE